MAILVVVCKSFKTKQRSIMIKMFPNDFMGHYGSLKLPDPSYDIRTLHIQTIELEFQMYHSEFYKMNNNSKHTVQLHIYLTGTWSG